MTASIQYKGVAVPDDQEYGTSMFMVPGCYNGDLKAVIIPEGAIRDRIRRLAHEVHEAIGDQPLVLLCVLKGSYKFFTTLVDELSVARHTCRSHVLIDFIRARSYEDTQTTGKVEITGLSNTEELRDKNVLIVDDIVDTGLTMSRIVNTIQGLGARQVWTSVLLSKRLPRTAAVQEDFVAFNIPNKFIVGFGLDYNQMFRDLGHICVMSENGIVRYRTRTISQSSPA